MVFYGKDDAVTVPEDVEKLYGLIPNLVNMSMVPFVHNNFIHGRDAKYIYNIIVNSLFNYNKNYLF